MSFELVHKQRVRHTDGWEVFSIGLNKEGYAEDGKIAHARVSRGTTYNRIHKETIWWLDGSPMDNDTRHSIAFRIKSGMAELSSLIPVVLPDDLAAITVDDSTWTTRIRPILESNPKVTKIREL